MSWPTPPPPPIKNQSFKQVEYEKYWYTLSFMSEMMVNLNIFVQNFTFSYTETYHNDWCPNMYNIFWDFGNTCPFQSCQAKRSGWQVLAKYLSFEIVLWYCKTLFCFGHQGYIHYMYAWLYQNYSFRPSWSFSEICT